MAVLTKGFVEKNEKFPPRRPISGVTEAPELVERRAARGGGEVGGAPNLEARSFSPPVRREPVNGHRRKP